MARCALCDARPQYRDRRSGETVCPEHARLEVRAAGVRRAEPALGIRRASGADYPRVGELARYFWDETIVQCFDAEYDVLACPAFLACEGSEVVGAASYAVERGWDALVLVMLNLLPAHQGRGGGRALLDALREEAAQQGLRRVIVATTNDDLPALALYQRCGFRLTEVQAGRVARHHGGEIAGFAGIPVRDELRLVLEVRR